MAERHARLIAFFGTEQERRRFILDKKLDPQTVILARPESMRGRNEPLEVIYCSGGGLTVAQSSELLRQIHVINTTYGKQEQ